MNAMMVAFSWILPGTLAGSGRPGLVRSVSRDMRSLRKMGIGLVVTLTEEALSPEPEECGLAGIHLPIENMQVPESEAVDEVCGRVRDAMARGQGVLVHCQSGLGRTGLLLACVLISMGHSCREALDTLRAINREYIQTRGQEQFVTAYADRVTRLRTVAPVMPHVHAVQNSRLSSPSHIAL